MKTHPLNEGIIRLWHHIAKKRRLQFLALLVLMVFSSFAEILSIGSVVPFLGVLTSPDRVFSSQAMAPFFQALRIQSPNELLLPLTITFSLLAVFAGGMRVLLLWFSTRLSFAAGADLSVNIYRRTLYQNYVIHTSRNSSEVISGISNKANEVIYNILLPILNLFSAILMLGAILTALMLINPLMALIAFSGFGLIYFVIIKIARKKLMKNSQCIARDSTLVIKSLQEGLGGIRDILIDGSQETYCDQYRKADHWLRRAQGSNQFISYSPRFVMEALGMVLIATLAYTLAQKPDGIAVAIPVLGALALGAQRLLPVLQQAYAAWSNIKGSEESLLETLGLLDQALPAENNISPRDQLTFKKEIKLKDINFSYHSEGLPVLKDLCLSIPKGGRIGFIGSTGGGKSTLLDIIMGLLQPSSGSLEVDDCLVTRENWHLWRRHIAHVPQSIFLADQSVEQNIAFGVPENEIDIKRVRKCAIQAQIAETIEGWPEQYQTSVGERGVKLSGGQRQRIGIARALYKNADLIIFDEATSALDSETERGVMSSIEGLGDHLTILMIAHRLSTLKNCSQIFELENGKIKRAGSYSEIIRV